MRHVYLSLACFCSPQRIVFDKDKIYLSPIAITISNFLIVEHSYIYFQTVFRKVLVYQKYSTYWLKTLEQIHV